MESIFGQNVKNSLEEILNPQSTVILIIDMQNDFASPLGKFAELGIDYTAISDIVQAISDLIELGRAKGVQCVWVKQTNYPNGEGMAPAWIDSMRMASSSLANSQLLEPPLYCVEGTWGQNLVEPLSAMSSERIVKKLHSSAFLNTGLADDLRRTGIETVVVAGTNTEGCVLSTARDA